MTSPGGVGAPPVRLSSVVRRFGGFTAVDDVSLTVRPGEVVGLLGANGAGKTTVLRVLLGLLVPTSGRVRLFGGPPSRASRRRLGYVPQGLGLWPDLTVRENLEFAAAAYGRRKAEISLPAGLAEHADRQVGGIGLGLQRQLAFTVALSHRPELLVLDEPTSGVGPLARAGLWDVIHEQADAGVAVLVTTHYMQEAQQCDRLVMLSRGRVVAAGTEREITGGVRAVEVETPQWARAFAAVDGAGLAVTLAGQRVRLADVDVPEVSRVLAAAGVKAEVRPVPATLEETMTIVDRASA